jgi:hypothetical protein
MRVAGIVWFTSVHVVLLFAIVPVSSSIISSFVVFYHVVALLHLLLLSRFKEISDTISQSCLDNFTGVDYRFSLGSSTDICCN